MAQAASDVRMDEGLKEQLTREKAMQAFRSLRKQAKDHGVSGMSLDEINKEIELTRQKKTIE